VIPFGSDVVLQQSNDFLGAVGDAHITALAIPFIHDDPTLQGHSFLLE
jgi:hypothetical protein